MFEVIESKINNFGKLIYLESSHEFVSEPSVNSDITILVGYIYILVLIRRAVSLRKFGGFIIILIGNRVY